MSMKVISRSWTSRPWQSRVSLTHHYQWWYRTALRLLSMISNIRITVASSASTKLMLVKSNWMKSTLQGNSTQLSQHMTPPAIKKTGRSSLPAKWSNRMTTSSSIERRFSMKTISMLGAQTNFTVKNRLSYLKNENHQLNSQCAFWAPSNNQVKVSRWHHRQHLKICNFNPRVASHR